VGLTRSLYLKELYVAKSHHRRGVGRLLMQAVFEAAGEPRCSRVEWTTDTGNAGARAFYHQLGLPVHPSKVFYRVKGHWHTAHSESGAILGEPRVRA
jgi:GNAT superfamily N-acetyltransferase